jgi:hypothetical protein
MFNSGFEKIAISVGGVKKVLEGHRAKFFSGEHAAHDRIKTRLFNNSFARTNETLSHVKHLPKSEQASIKRNLLRGHIANYRKKQGLQSAKEVNKARKANAGPTREQVDSAYAKVKEHMNNAYKKEKSDKFKKNSLIVGSVLGAGGIGAYMWSRHKKNKAANGETPEPVSQIENNYHTPAHLQRDPVYSLMG